MRKALIFAAGLGTRLAPLTDSRPKALVELKGRALLWHVAERLQAEGFTNLTINVHHFADQIKDYVSHGPFAEWAASNGISINISDESDLLLDTGGGLRKAAPLIFDSNDSPVLIHNVDILSNAHLDELYHSIGGADAMLLVSRRETSRYLLFDDQMRLRGWQNIKTGEVRPSSLKPQTSNLKTLTPLAFSGIHVVSKHMVDAMKDWPDKFGIIDFYIQNCDSLNIRGLVQPDLKLTDIGKIDVLRALEAE